MWQSVLPMMGDTTPFLNQEFVSKYYFENVTPVLRVVHDSEQLRKSGQGKL
jgi:hypothetical protein